MRSIINNLILQALIGMVLVTLTTPDDLYTLMIAPNPGPSGTFSLSDDYELGNSISMVGYAQPAQSIGNTDTANGFQGTFDGKGYTITIDQVVTNYRGLFNIITNSISNIRLVYNTPGISIQGSTGVTPCGGFIGSARNNVTNCHVTMPDNITIGDPAKNYSCGGFIGLADINNLTNNCTLTAGNNLTITCQLYAGGFIGRQNGSTVTNCTITIQDNLNIDGFYVGGLVGWANFISNVSLSIGDNCILGDNSLCQISGGIVGQSSNILGFLTNNVKAVYGNNTTITSSVYVGGAIGNIINSLSSNNTIVLFKNNTRINGPTAGAVIGYPNNNIIISNIFALYNDYSIIGSQVGPIYGRVPPTSPASVLSNTCGNPLPGSSVTNMSTTSLDTIIAYIQAIPYLADLIPYIQSTYPCYTRPVEPIIPPPCPCTAYLCNSNPQNTNYDESEDKSRITDQTIHSNVDIKLSEMWAGTRVQSVPIFKSYDEMMRYKQGSLKYRR